MFGDVIHRTDIPARTDLGAELTTNGKRAYKKVLYGQQEGKCRACRLENYITNMELDRIIPGSKGGTYHKENLQLLCSGCNKRKSNKSHQEFLAEINEFRPSFTTQTRLIIS